MIYDNDIHSVTSQFKIRNILSGKVLLFCYYISLVWYQCSCFLNLYILCYSQLNMYKIEDVEKLSAFVGVFLKLKQLIKCPIW